MNDLEKAKEISMITWSDFEESKKQNLNIGKYICDACLDMAKWKDEQLNNAIDKALERNGEFLKAGKITQYGYDMAFVTIQNIREYLKQ